MQKPFSVVAYRRKAASPSRTRGGKTADELSQLRRHSHGLQIGGQIIASAGIALMFFVAMVWPFNPSDLTVFWHYLYIPNLLSGELNSLGLETSAYPLLDGAVPNENAAILDFALLLVGLFAVFRRRWIIVATIGALLCLPWELIGYAAPVRWMAVALFAVAIPTALLPVSALVKAGIFVPALVALPFFTSMASFPNAMRIDGNDIDYRRVTFTKINADPVTAARWQRFLNTPDQGGDTDAVANARAFARAQMRYREADAAGGLAAIDQIDRSGGAANDFERNLLNVIRQGLAMQGAFGEQEQTRAFRDYQNRVLLCWFGFGLGLLLALAGPLSDMVREVVVRRLVRIDVARQKLETVASVTAAVAGRTYDPSSFQRQDSKAISSIAKSDARGAISTLTARLAEFRFVAIVLFGAAIAAYYLHRLFWIPDLGQNTAFHMVALPLDVARYAVDARFLPAAALDDPHPFAMMLSVSMASTIGLAAAIALFILFKSRVPALLVLLASMLLGSFAPHLFAPAPSYEVAASAIRDEHRLVLLSKVASGNDEVSMALRPAIDSMESSLDPGGSQPGTAATIGRAEFIDSNEAALTLAQLAYLENDAATAADLLNSISFETPFSPPYKAHRLKIIRAWVEVHGQTTTMNAKSVGGGMAPSVLRAISILFGVISAVALVAGIGMSVLCALVFRRRSSLRDMLENAPSPAQVAPDRLGRILGR